MDLKTLCEPHHLVLIIIGMMLVILTVATGGNLRDIARWFGLFKDRGGVNIEIGEFTKMPKTIAEVIPCHGDPQNCPLHQALETRINRSENDIQNLFYEVKDLNKSMSADFESLHGQILSSQGVIIEAIIRGNK